MLSLYSKISTAKFSTAKKEYTCLTCCNVIPKDSKYVTCNHFSKELAEAWEELTKYRPWAKKFECFISLKFCSGRCNRSQGLVQFVDCFLVYVSLVWFEPTREPFWYV